MRYLESYESILPNSRPAIIEHDSEKVFDYSIFFDGGAEKLYAMDNNYRIWKQPYQNILITMLTQTWIVMNDMLSLRKEYYPLLANVEHIVDIWIGNGLVSRWILDQLSMLKTMALFYNRTAKGFVSYTGIEDSSKSLDFATKSMQWFPIDVNLVEWDWK